MTEGDWLKCGDPRSMLEFLNRGPTRRKFGLFACACCRTVFDWLVDNRSREAVEVVEAFADGLMTENDIERASDRASRAARIGAGPPAQAVSWAADAAPDYICCLRVTGEVGLAFGEQGSAEWFEARVQQADLLRDIFGNPFRPVEREPAWLTSDVLALARGIYDDHAFDRMPILADALQDAGCNADDILNHCRYSSLRGAEPSGSPATGHGTRASPHVRGCWVVDLLLGKG
jgi:hypothetical protein